MKNNVTASERRGIIVVAVLALLITGSGWLVSTCRRSSGVVAPPEIEILSNGDSRGDVSDGSDRKRSKRVRKDSAGGRKKSVKTYRRRSPRDEGV